MALTYRNVEFWETTGHSCAVTSVKNVMMKDNDSVLEQLSVTLLK